MSKEIYVVDCYTCQHNGQETCKGCNTLLNGDVEPYENWELREDLSQKDQRIAELEQELAEKDKENEELKLKLDIRAMNLQNINTERMEAVRNQTQLAIQELKKVKSLLFSKAMQITGTGVDCVRLYVIDKTIDQQIKELKGEKDAEG